MDLPWLSAKWLCSSTADASVNLQRQLSKNGWDRLQQENMSRSRECPHLYTAVDDPRILRSPLSLKSPIDILTTPRRVVYDAVKGAELSFHPKADGNPLKSTSYRIKNLCQKIQISFLFQPRSQFAYGICCTWDQLTGDPKPFPTS
jgi:hypothetical protein